MEYGLTKEQYSIFQKEAMYGSISVGGICKNKCIFCSTKVSKKCLGVSSFHNYISYEDLYSILPIVNWAKQYDELNKFKNEVQIGNGISTLTCEPFQHPEYINFIKIVHNYNKDWYLHSGTVGKWVNPQWFDIFKENNMHFFVSINSLDKNMRSLFMKSQDDYEGLLLFLKECKDIMYKLSFVYHGDLDIFKKDIDMLLEIDSDFQNIPIRFFLPEYSQYSDSSAKELYNKALNTWEEANIYLKSNIKYPQPAVTKIDDTFNINIFNEISEYRKNLDERISHIINILNNKNIDINDVGFLFPESTYNYSIKYININRILIKNIVTGGSYKVAGLLSKEDIINAINKNKKYKYYIISRDVFRYFGNDLLGKSPKEYGDYHFILA